MSLIIDTDVNNVDLQANDNASSIQDDSIAQARAATPLSLEELVKQLRREAHPRPNMKRIRRGIANLQLMMTLTTAERSEWLWGVTPTQYYFEYRGLRIYRRNCRITKTTIARKKQVHELRRLQQELTDLSQRYHTIFFTLPSKEETEIVKHLIHLAPVIMAEMAETVSTNADRHIGQIYNADDCLVEDIDLVDIYSWINNYADKEEAVRDIFSRYGLNKNSVPVDVDGRTHWHMYVGDLGQWQDDNIYQDDIVFQGRNHVYGHVVAEKDGLCPYTYWCKSKDMAGTKMFVPFEVPMPLWNLEKIQNYPDKHVVLSENLVGAYHLQRQINKKINNATECEQRILCKEDVYSLLRYDSQFETALRKSVLGEQDAENELNLWDYAYISARIAVAYGAEEAAADRIFNDYYQQQQIGVYNYPPRNEIDEDFECIIKVWSQDRNKCLEQLNKKEIKCQITPDFLSAQAEAHGYYKKITQYIAAQRERDKKAVADLEAELEAREKFCFSSWFGEEETIFDTNWKELKGRHVTYVLAQHNRSSFRRAFKISIALRKYAETLTFDDCGKLLTPDDLEKIALDEFKIDKTTLRFKNKSLMEFFDVFDPKKKVHPAEYILDNFITSKSTTLLYAPTGVGKTWFTMCLAQAVAHGSPIFQNNSTWKAVKPRYVAYIDSEMNEQNFLRRLGLMDEYYRTMKKKAPGDCPLLFKQVAESHLNLGDDDGVDRDRITEWLAQAEHEGKPVELLILDNLSTLTGFNDSAKSWNNIFTWLSQLSHRKKNPVACLVVHHTNKQGEQRGSSAKTATADNVIRLERQSADTGNGCLNFIVHIEKGRDIPDTSGIKGHIPVEIQATDKKFSCKVVAQFKSEAEKKSEAMDYLNGAKTPPLDVIAALTGLSINTIKEYSRKQSRRQRKVEVDESDDEK